MNLLHLLKTLPVVTFERYGTLISFADIVQACRQQGLDNHDLVEQKLIELGKEQKLEVINDEYELLIGVKLHEGRF